MKCDCVTKINEKLREMTGDPKASLDILFTLNEGIDDKLFIPYSYRTKKQDGTLTIKEKSGKLALDKCPFCGE